MDYTLLMMELQVLGLADCTVLTEADGPTSCSNLKVQTEFHHMAKRIYRYLMYVGPVSIEQVRKWKNKSATGVTTARSISEPLLQQQSLLGSVCSRIVSSCAIKISAFPCYGHS